MTAIHRRPLRSAVFAAALLACGCASSPALALRVGVDSGVDPEATGTPPGGAAARQLTLGQDVLYNERIATNTAGRTQILFVDASTLSVGPNSSMVIDQFVYDPQAGTGKLAASLTRGVFRFVGGALSKNKNGVTFRTPIATIGIRGGVVLIDVNPACGTASAAPQTAGCNALRVVFAYGNGVTVTGVDGVTQSITRPGFQVTVAGAGAPPAAPAPAAQATIGNFLSQLNGRSGANGGAQTVPTEAIVEKNSAAVISSTGAPTIASATQTQPPTPANTLAQLNINTQLGQFVPPPSPSPPSPTPPPPPPPPPPTPPPTILNIAGGYTDTDSLGTSQGFSGTPMAYAGGNVVNGQLEITLGTGQVVSFPLVVGSASLSSTGAGTSSPLGQVTGTTYLSPDETFFFADLTPISDTTQREFVYGGLPIGQRVYQTAAGTSQLLAFAVQPDAALQSLIPFIRQTAGGSLAGASISPLIFATPANSPFLTGSASTKALQASLAISGAGASQSSVILVLVGNIIGTTTGLPSLTGVMHGSYLGNAAGQPTRINAFYATPSDGNGNSFYGGNGISGFVLSSAAAGTGASATETATLTQSPTGSYQFFQPAIPTALPPAATAGQSLQTLQGWFGGIMTKEPLGGGGNPLDYVAAGKTQISTDPADLQIAATSTGGDPFTAAASGINPNNGIVLQFGSLNPGVTNARQAFISDSLFAALESLSPASTVGGLPADANIYLVTASAAPPTALLPNGLCACQYLQWGYWGGELDTPAGNGNPARVDVGHINSWVAGPPTSTSDIAGLGGATLDYSGNLFGTVDNHGAKYLASGGLAASYNFGTHAGTFAVNNYDGLSFTANGTAPLSGANYTFGFKNGSGLEGLINGSFYGPGAIETGGNFAFQKGSGYFTSGIFGARMVGQ